MQLRREIGEKQEDLAKLQEERHEGQRQLETDRDRLAAGEQELEAKKRELMQKRLELEKADSLKDLTIRQVQDVSYFPQLFKFLTHFTACVEEI